VRALQDKVLLEMIEVQSGAHLAATLAAAPDAPGPDPDYPPTRLALEVRRQVLDVQT